jgi:hypothetical protein
VGVGVGEGVWVDVGKAVGLGRLVGVAVGRVGVWLAGKVGVADGGNFAWVFEQAQRTKSNKTGIVLWKNDILIAIPWLFSYR